MVARAVFEVPTLADAVSKAHRVAPTKGAAFDKAAGVLIDVDPQNFLEPCVITATDLDVSLRQTPSVLSMGDERCIWRLPSRLFADLMANLPMSPGSQVELKARDDGYIYFTSGKTRAKFMSLDADTYPQIPVCDVDKAKDAEAFASRLSQVTWACDRQAGILSGVHLDGKFIHACNRAAAAIVPCVVPVDRPVTAPLSSMATVLRNTGTVALYATETHLEVMPDPNTQARCALLVEKYPDLNALILDRLKPTEKIKVNAELFSSALDRMMVLVKEERMPITNVIFGHERIVLQMEVPQVGKIADEIECEGGPKNDLRIVVTPDVFKSSLTASGRPFVEIAFGPDDRAPIRVSDDNGYLAVMMPRVMQS